MLWFEALLYKDAQKVIWDSRNGNQIQLKIIALVIKHLEAVTNSKNYQGSLLLKMRYDCSGWNMFPPTPVLEM